MASNNSVVAAYCEVFHVKRSEVKKPVHTNRIKEALKAVWAYDGLFEGETELDGERRRELESPALGEYTELGEYLKGISNSEDLLTKTNYEVVFAFYKRMIDAGEASKSGNDTEPASVITEEEVKEAETAPTQNESSDNKNTFNKEANIMADKQSAIEMLEGIETKLQNGAVATPEAAADKLTVDSTRTVLNSEAKERAVNTTNTKVQKFILSQQPASERVVGGVGATGTLTVEGAKKALQKFIVNFGVNEQPDGTVTFSKCLASDVDKAKEMYDVLKAAANGKEQTLKANVSTNKGAVIGYTVIGPNGTPEAPMTPEKMTEYLLNKTLGLLKAETNADVEVHMASAKSDAKPAGKGKGSKKEVKKSKYISSVRNRKALPDTAYDYRSVIKADGKDEMKDGIKSELCAKYDSGRTGKNDKPIFSTYRIPLKTLQHELVVQEDYDKLRTGKSGVGAFVPTDFNNATWQETQLNAMAGIIAAGIANADDSEVANKIRQVLGEAKAKEAKEQASDM